MAGDQHRARRRGADRAAPRRARAVRGIHRADAAGGSLRGTLPAEPRLAAARHPAGAGVTWVEAVAADGTRIALAPRTTRSTSTPRAAALGAAAAPGARRRVSRCASPRGSRRSGTALPEGLRQGVIRLAAHHYRERDMRRAHAVPPAAVAALWRPWRRMRLMIEAEATRAARWPRACRAGRALGAGAAEARCAARRGDPPLAPRRAALAAVREGA